MLLLALLKTYGSPMDLGPLDDDDKWLVDRFRERHPNEINAICELAPLRKQNAWVDPLLLNLFNIVATYGRRLSDDEDYSGLVLQSIRSAEAAAQNFDSVVDGIMKMDITHIRQILFFAQRLHPEFFGKNGVMDFYRALNEFNSMMAALSAAIKLGTGTFDRPRGRGRPPSPYTRPALELIELWEFITAEKPSLSTGWMIKKVPTPKKLDIERPKGGNHVETKQSSTEFIRLSLRMIKPEISDSEVFTAIKKALKVRDEGRRFFERASHDPLLRWLMGGRRPRLKTLGKKL